MPNLSIKGIEGMTVSDVELEVQSGAKFVIFQYCVSIGFMTFRRSSDVYFVRFGESAWKKGFGFTALTFLLGWWGIPWGFIYTPLVIYTNMKGGKDVTEPVIEHFHDGDSEYVEMAEMAVVG